MSFQTASNSLRVMLVDDRVERSTLLDLALRDVDCTLVARVTGDENLLSAVNRCDPDVILIDLESPGRDTLENLESVRCNSPRPIVMFSRDENCQTISRAIKAGVSAYVVDGMRAARVRPIIDTAIARFRHFSELETELRQVRQQLQERKVIDRAKGIIMRQRRISEEKAYRAMQKLAMDSNRRLADVAERIIDTASILSE